jgi:hypothetical protein
MVLKFVFLGEGKISRSSVCLWSIRFEGLTVEGQRGILYGEEEARGMVVWVLRGMIRVYQWTVGTMLGQCCRFYPSCSEYALEALRVHGVRGVWLAAVRVVKCHPWHRGGVDLVPERRGKGCGPRGCGKRGCKRRE